MKPLRRRHFFIDKQLQTKYMLLTILLLLIYSLIFVTLIFLPYILPLHFNLPLAERAEAAKILLTLHKSVWPPLVVVILLLGTLSIFITHKIVGPLYRVNKVLSEICEGNLGVKVTLRKGDDLQELAEQLNHLTSELSSFVADLKHDYGTLTGCIDELESRIEAKTITPETGQELMQRINTSRKNIEVTLEKFKVTP